MAAAVGERGSGGHAGMKRIILVEDDHDLRASLGDCLEEAGFAVALAGSAEQLHRELAAASFHVAVLDVNLPDASGYTLAAALPADMAVVMLTGRGSVADRVAGYDSGADLYLVKPTDGAELVAGIRAVLRRRAALPRAVRPAWWLDAPQRALHAPNGRAVLLTPRETSCVARLLRRPGTTVPRAELIAILGYDALPRSSRSFDMFVARLRQRIEAATGLAAPIETVHAAGLVLHDRPAEPPPAA